MRISQNVRKALKHVIVADWFDRSKPIKKRRLKRTFCKSRYKTQMMHEYNHKVTMNNDLIIREVSEIGFSPYVIFRDIIKDEYNHVRSFYFDDLVDDKILQKLKEHYPDAEFQTKSYGSISKDSKTLETYYFSVENKLFLSINRQKEDTNIVILANEMTDKLNKFLEEFKVFETVQKQSQLNIICHNGRSFYTEAFDIKTPESKAEFFDCYNVEFEAISAQIKEKLSVNNGKGIALFHGDVGTGKTTYLRHLITTIDGKKIIYMPPDMADRIASPEFVTFLMDNPNSILIIEDAENVLRAREAGGSQAISNLLNVSDGILGDALHLQIVCTFNCPRDHIDKALLRPGRLIAEYKFDKLKPERANDLINTLYGEDGKLTDIPMSLAEIFNMEEELIKSKETKTSFGFIPA